jgi:taurine dioxygenase
MLPWSGKELNGRKTMAYQTIDVRPIAGACGAEIFGADVSKPLNNAMGDEIYQAFLDYQVVAIRDQVLTPQQQVAFARRFGEPNIYPFVKGFPEAPEVIAIVKEPHEAKNFGGKWHSDSTYLKIPPVATMLYAVEVPPVGGDTMFSSAALAFDRLSDELKRKLSDLTAINSAALLDGGRARGMRYANIEVVGHDKMEMEAEHPVIRTCPETGRKSIYVNVIHTKCFKGWTDDESRPLIDYLIGHITRPEHQCRVRWQKGTVTIWDNRAVQHLAMNDYHGYRREVHRVTIEGNSTK